ncbi:type IVB secretion system protein IcmF [Legionella pneumophila]|uniref:IcmF n=1 Tax=Legionella pneumophila subsp. pascullei TaxID=91890 RepID=A0AAX2IS88_LEGPN|nr:type IVB secretion system protein IcmF [Legionella pneumophila]AMP88608.1 type VI secretion protein IcmF [Legionella pneumophila subsp. pascullei]AMP91517.1 type VI secretion protein IcmF [Legionella pneumophila subsp. pascullei]AMP94504.1 type VI secretion protein IcmF [Legionella pneumophila subsp. pascullei]SQG89306.1 IcmF [Legionella pneumophila subsp. pascullei]VEH04447.1 IcmF [Legionella pneumophila subsp. pascullei]
MDNSLRALCDAIKKILSQLKPQVNQLSFIIITGKNAQGKSALLKQSNMEEMPVFSEEHAKLYFNQKGIIVELGENWLTNSKTLLLTTLKQLNKCNRHLKITGLILCVDVNDLLIAEPAQFTEQKKSHLQLLQRLGVNLGYQAELALIFTKMDTLAGFSEFYQMDHVNDLSKPLGFSLDCVNQPSKKIETYSLQFNQLIEALGQQVINKMHPVRSTIKRSLIREFPMQLASLRAPIQSLIQGISPKLFHVHSIFFTSAQQGGVSIDRLNKKIQHEYALVVQDTFPQATNFRSYFVEGALKTIQEQCVQIPQVTKFSQRPFIAVAVSLAGLSLLTLSYNHYKTSHILDEASKELLAYEALNNQGTSGAQALYHLSQAANKMNHITSNSISLPTVHQLKLNLQNNTQNRLQGEFLPSLANELEQVITNPGNTPITRYKALKIYLMLGQAKYFSAQPILDWFQQQWKGHASGTIQKQLALLKQTLNNPPQNIPIKSQVISDARNYLNALPTSYLYYSIAKEYFPQEKQKIVIEGFTLPTDEVPTYFTKTGFTKTINDLPKITNTLQSENWVLARQDLSQLHNMLIQAYCFDYVTWWQTFMKKSQPLRYQDYQQGRQLTKLIQQSNSFYKFANLIQQETKPDLTEGISTFNQFIANQFTDLNLTTLSSIKELDLRISELERFIATLSVVNDGGKTAFTITRSRFINDNSSDPVSLLYSQARQLPEPLSSWTRQIAGDAWVILIRDSRQFINNQWQKTVYREFQNSIAKRYPFDSSQTAEIDIADFNRFFSTHGLLNTYSEQYIKPFLDTSSPEWKPKAVNDFILPISNEVIDELIRANIITNMFFPDHSDESKIDFSLQKISLDPVVSNLVLEIGGTKLMDNQTSDSLIRFTWPQNNAKLALDSIEGNHYELTEHGTWAIFKLLEKVNVLVDEQDSSSLQILFEVNSNSGRYLLKTNNQINPFTPGILNGFTLNDHIA